MNMNSSGEVRCSNLDPCNSCSSRRFCIFHPDPSGKWEVVFKIYYNVLERPSCQFIFSN